MHSRHFHDGGGPIGIRPHQKLARVESTERRAMSHAEYCRYREPFAYQLIKPCLCSLVNRQGRLVEKEPIGFLDQNSIEAEVRAILYSTSTRSGGLDGYNDLREHLDSHYRRVRDT